MFTQYFPYKLAPGLSLEAEKEKYADRCFDLMNEYAPNFKRSVIARQVLSPVDLEQRFGLTGGNIMQGVMSLSSLSFMRPVPGYADYRTPVRGLYLCGAATHPGGGVMGACGYNAAREIMREVPAGGGRARAGRCRAPAEGCEGSAHRDRRRSVQAGRSLGRLSPPDAARSAVCPTTTDPSPRPRPPARTGGRALRRAVQPRHAQRRAVRAAGHRSPDAAHPGRGLRRGRRAAGSSGTARSGIRSGPAMCSSSPAGVEHRFEEFSDDLAVWVFFYGPEGGEAA